MSNNRLRAAVAAALAGTAGASIQVGWAQEDAAESQAGLEEIIVTATRREQDLQEVPVSIVALTDDALEVRGIQNLEDVGAAIPNINIQGGGGGTAGPQFRVRGIPNVGTYIDGVWQIGTAGFLTQEFVDIERIEVLRGPQGTMYGRDSLGGSIRIWTERPSEQFGADIRATVGSLDRRDVKLSVDLPLTENLLTKWTGASLYRDGYIQNVEIDQKNGGIDQKVFRGDLLWTPTDNLSLRFNYLTDQSDFTEPRIQDAIFDTAANMGQAILIKEFYALAGLEPYQPENLQAGFPGGKVGEWENRSAISLPNNIEHEQTTLDVEWAITDSISVNFLSAYTEQVFDNYVDWDNSPFMLVDDYNRSTLDVFSQEIQLSGQRGRFNWMAGVYYWSQEGLSRNARWQIEEFAGGTGFTPEELEEANNFDPSLLPQVIEGRHIDVDRVFNSPECIAIRNSPLANCQSVYLSAVRGRYDNLSRNEIDGTAVFGGVTVTLTDRLELNLGLRYHDQDSLSQNLAPIPGVTAPKPEPNESHVGGDVFAGVPVGVPTAVSFDKVTSNVSLQMQFNDDLMGYVTVSEGFDSGGISAPTINGVRTEIPYDPQTLTNYEVGIRSDWLNGGLRFNATLFHGIWDDIQNVGVVYDDRGVQLPTLVTTNVGEAQTEGVEIELSYLPTERFLVNLNVGLLDTEYTDIAEGTLFLDETTEFQQAPETTYNIGLQYNATLSGGGTLTPRLDYSYSSQFWRSLPFLRMDAYSPPVPPSYDESGDLGTLNARVVYVPPSGEWELSVFGTNLTNEYLLNSGFFHGIWGFDFATVARPREAGVSMRFRFD